MNDNITKTIIFHDMKFALKLFFCLNCILIQTTYKLIGSPPLYSLLPLWAGDAKEGQLTKMLCPEFDGKSSCPLKGKY